MTKRKVLFLCTGNSARSQMAEGWLRHLAGDRFEAHSAGTRPLGVNPLSIVAMREVGIDLSGHTSKHVDTLLTVGFDYVITVCDNAQEQCPYFPGQTTRLHWSLPDPAAATGGDEERLQSFREVRDDLRARIEDFLSGVYRG